MDKDIVEIIPHLFISNWFTSNNPVILKKFNIKAVITLETHPKPNEILKYYKNNNIDFMYINIDDSPNANIYDYFDSSYDFINYHIKKGENVLVHCYAGISRSSSIILNYMCRFLYSHNNLQHENPENVLYNTLKYSVNKRPIINPNQGFLNQLLMKTKEYKKNNLYLMNNI